MSELCVITTISNPANYESRFRLYHEFRQRIEASGATLYTIELATGDQKFSVTDASNPLNIQVRSNDEIWYKENLINVALRRLPKSWQYVAWLDADILFVRPNWVGETVSLLQRHELVQMFSHVLDLGPKYEPLKIQEGFVHRLSARANVLDGNSDIGQTGYAWAAQRSVLDRLGGLIDWSILGSNDYFMALALEGKITPESTRMPGTNYAAQLLDWQTRCQECRNFGCLETTILHFWHGRRSDRGYDSRWRILVDNQFDPDRDLIRNSDGLFSLSGNKPALLDAQRKYFRSRNEDAVVL